VSRKITDEEIAGLRRRGFAADASARGRLLAVADLLCAFTTEEEGLTALEIARVLGECGNKTPTEASVRDDLAALIKDRPLGIEIAAPSRGENIGYRVMRRALAPDEAVLLSDLVRTCKFINYDQREELCERLQAFVPDERLESAEAAVYVDDRDRGAGPDIFEIVRRVSEAIVDNKKVCFRYHNHLMDGTEPLSDPMEENPVALIFSYGHYYLEVFRIDDKHPEGEVIFRRLDRMRQVMVPGKPIEHLAHIEELRRSVVSTARELVDMMGYGPTRTLFLKVQGPRAKYVYDRFGHDLHFQHVADDGSVGYACIRVKLGPTFYRWLFGMEGIALHYPDNATWVRPFFKGTGHKAPPIADLQADFAKAMEGYRVQFEKAWGACEW